jgi:hypothetical protein
VRGSG